MSSLRSCPHSSSRPTPVGFPARVPPPPFDCLLGSLDIGDPLGEPRCLVGAVGGHDVAHTINTVAVKTGRGCSISFTAPVKSVNTNYEVMGNSQAS